MDAKPKEDEQQYAIKTTQPTTTTEKKTTTHTPPPTMSTTEEVKPVKPPKDYIVEIPIVNVSFQLVPGRLPPKAIFDTEDSFDKIFDVKPWPNMTYKSTVLPLLQFSLEDEDVGGALRTPVAVEPELPEFQVDFNSDIFTPDYRSLPMFPYHTFVSRPHDVFTSHYRTSQSPLNKEHSESWDAVNAILKNLNRSGHVDGKTKVDDNVEKLLQGLAKIGPNETDLYGDVFAFSMWRSKEEKPLTLLDHESWENMVHAASLMAVALNQSVTAREDVDTQGDNVTISTLRQVLSTTN
ncbi:unnamed protein product [Spodoptera littoralis]|uniref:Uncharacterized protein n=1 Tax=Spodoptera littoralis TaxID=7109 RepID=A0A9P0ICQ5_SPOLI|nr:unnamed protein product [Spodoptera littoralis]CAH1643486.1 unnamed protein product [Spodoptera littoralis]